MKGKIRLTEQQFNGLIRRIIREVDEQYYKITPEEYVELMKLSGYHGQGISRLPRFGGKPLWITGSLSLRNTPTDSLGNVGYIEGNLDISYTKVSNIDNISIKGYLSDYGTPLEKRRIAIEQRRKRDESESRRTEGDWDLNSPNIDDEGMKANALFQYLEGDGLITTLSDDDNVRVGEIKSEIKRLTDERESLDKNSDEWTDVDEQIDELESELEDLLSDVEDVYSIYPVSKGRRGHYGLDVFEVLSIPNAEFTVGTDDEMETAALQYAKDLIDDTGIDGFNESFVENHIDLEELKSYFEDWYRDDIYSNPEVYFNDDEFELSSEQEDRIEAIDAEIAQYESEQLDLDTDDEDYQYLYDDFQEKIDELESEKDEITPNTNEPTDDMVERVLEDRLDEVAGSPLYYIREYGLNVGDFVDIDEMADDLVQTDGWGVMNGYDGTYDSINVGGTDYYVMRIN
jgi:hypothetical protein